MENDNPIKENIDMDNRLYVIKYKINEYIESHLKYYITNKTELKNEKEKLHSALKDLFQNVKLDDMRDIDTFCGKGRFDYLNRKCRERWGKKFIEDIYEIIINRLD